MAKRAPLVLVLALTLLSCASAGASGWKEVASGGASARAYGIKVIVPGQAGGATPTVSAPNDAVQFSGGFSYGGDPSHPLVSTGSANASVSAAAGTNATASASAEVSTVSVFGGEITAASVVAHASASAQPGSATGNITGTYVTNLVALGQQASTDGATVVLGDWGSLRTIESGATGTTATGYHGFVTALDIHLTADHGGLPAGTSILVGYAEVAAEAAPPEPVVPAPKARGKKGPKVKKAAPEPKLGLPPIRQPPKITPPLKTPGGHVFPVYGPSSFIDTFGAFRGDVSGGWHHGDDVFAPLGAPLLACASGTVFSVGWNPVGGNRLWLRDGAGNLYYYAHLSAFSPSAVNGNKVNAGDVIGFVGNTGDAQATPYHLHFEIHPVGLLGLGYDGAVDPTTYLTAWKHLQDVSFEGGNAWAPRGTIGTAPKSGAILISATDISSADGLDPGSLQRTLRPVTGEGSPAATASARVHRHKPGAGQPTAAGP